MIYPRSAAFALLVFLASPAAANPDDAANRTMADAVNAFGVDLYQKVKPDEANLFFSPFSISAALTMTREGARGETAAEMDRVLHLPTQRGAAYKALLAGLKPRQVRDYDEHGSSRKVPAFSLNVANNLWGQQGFSFLGPFTQTLVGDYGAPLQRIDFRKTAAARKAINDWVAKQTKTRIKDIVPEGKPARSTRLALANAIHFKAKWKDAFQESSTRTKPFHTLDGRELEAKLMQSVKHLPYYEDKTVQVVEIPYLGNDASMVVILPRARTGLPAISKALTAQQLTTWRKASKRPKVDVRLPRFKFTSSLDLVDVLPAMGMPLAFDSRKADFSGMTTEQRLYVGAVLHKAFVAVDEKGTEAAAATVVLMMAGSAPPRPVTPKPFVADHPFLFVIRHNKTGCILFMGRVGDPTKS